MKVSIREAQEVKDGILTEHQLEEKIDRHAAVLVKGGGQPVAIGQGLLIKVNTNIGVSDETAFAAGLFENQVNINIRVGAFKIA